MNATFLVLTLVLVGAGAPTQGFTPRDATPVTAARAELDRQAQKVDVYLAARERLVAERAQLQARADVLAAQVAQAKRNRGVLSDTALKTQLREALEVGKALEATDRKLATLDRMIEDGVTSLDRTVDRLGRPLRDADRQLLAADAARVHARLPARQASLPAARSVEVTAGMDSEALLERADLARDYEDKLRREALRADARIRSLEDQQSMAGEARRMAGDQHLFDEGEVVIRQTTVSVAKPAARAAADNRPTGSTTTGGNPAVPGSGGGGTAENGDHGGSTPASGALDTGTGGYGGGGNAPTDTTGGRGTPTADPVASTASLPRSQTVVDERTFALLRESRTPTEGLSAAEELRQLRERRAALLRAATRLKAVQEQLKNQAQGTPAAAPR